MTVKPGEGSARDSQALASLLRSWPVDCVVRAELPVPADGLTLATPSLIVATSAPTWFVQPGRPAQRIDRLEALVVHKAPLGSLSGQAADFFIGST